MTSITSSVVFFRNKIASVRPSSGYFPRVRHRAENQLTFMFRSASAARESARAVAARAGPNVAALAHAAMQIECAISIQQRSGPQRIDLAGRHGLPVVSPSDPDVRNNRGDVLIRHDLRERRHAVRPGIAKGLRRKPSI